MPPGYDRLRSPGAEGVVWTPLTAALLSALQAAGTVYDYARRHPDHRPLVGRGPAYAVAIGDARVVVRHARHGGVLAPISRDVFWGSTRAPHELAVSTRLRDAGVATPQVLGYVLYPVMPVLRRSDVLIREVPDAADLLTVLRGMPAGAQRSAVWEAVRVLVEDLGRVGAVHADLNVKNVLLEHPTSDRPTAYALDVDRVQWRRPGAPAVTQANWDRLHRSARKQGLQ